MSTREQFENAYRLKYATVCALSPNKFDRDEFGEYVQAIVEVSWQMWQASRALALDEAYQAVTSERLIDPTEHHGDVVYQRAIEDCESAILALPSLDGD